MGNTPKKRAVKKVTGSYKFADMRAEAAAKTAGEEKRPEIPPFVIGDINPPIVITAPDTLERQLVIAEMIGTDGVFEAGAALPLLRALCGPAFGQVWSLIRNDTDANTAIALVQTLVAHFYEVLEVEAAGVPGGSEGSSD